MRRPLTAFVTAFVLVALALISTSAASADVQVARVGLPVCLGNGGPGTGSGQASVPAGSEILLRAGVLAGTPVQDQQTVAALNVIASINGIPLADPNSYWGPMQFVSPADGGPGWFDDWEYNTGVVLQSGEQMVVQYVWQLTTGVRVEVAGVGTLFYGPLDDVFQTDTCTITASS